MDRKFKFVLVGGLALLLAIGAAWKLSGASATGAIRQFILQTAADSVNGTVDLGEIDFSFSGSLVAKQVELKDKAGALVASAKTMAVDFDTSDLLSRRIGVDRVRKITLDGLVLNLTRDKQSLWNSSEVLKNKPAAAAEPLAAFRGLVTTSNSTITVVTPDTRYLFKMVEGTLDFAKYPDIAVNLKSKDGAGAIVAAGVWNLSGGGTLTLSSEGLEIAALAPTIPLKGPAEIHAVLTGTTQKPTASGSFKIPAGSLENLSFSNVSGDFSFADSAMTLANTSANALGGSVAISGPFHLDTLRFAQRISGQNIDSSHLSDRDIQGRLSFSADVSGQGSWGGANADGAFSMGAGSVSGISFEALSGNFAKRGANMSYYNLKITIDGLTINIGDADSLDAMKNLFKSPILPFNRPAPNLPILPKIPTLPFLPGIPALPKF